jgi:hypothetical protein
VGVPQACCPPLDGDDAQSELQRLSVELFGELGDRHDVITVAKEREPGGYPMLGYVGSHMASWMAWVRFVG